jgi:hypothetical protein
MAAKCLSSAAISVGSALAARWSGRSEAGVDEPGVGESFVDGSCVDERGVDERGVDEPCTRTCVLLTRPVQLRRASVRHDPGLAARPRLR